MLWRALSRRLWSDGNLLFKGKYTLDFGTEAVAEGKIQPVVASASASAEPTEPSEDAAGV